jgi:hypothetical protein
MNKVPQVLVRVGRFDNSLEDAVKKCTEPLTRARFGLGNTIKYAIFKESAEPYFLMVSQQKERIVNPMGYNVILTVASYSDSRNQQVASQFEKETGMNLGISVPDFLKKGAAIIGRSFQAFEKNPEEAMSVLR